jgi:pimeloyl-ACP methyl ester carboxylesterase
LTDFLTIHGVRLEIQWSGAATTGPVIVLLHEGLGSVAIWKDFPDRLAEATNLRVFAYSRQGYGQSDPITGPREPDYMHVEAEAVLPAVLAAAGIDRPILFGHSDGASIALIYAATHPVTALVLEAPHVFVEPLTVESIAKAKTIYETTDLGAKLGRYHRDADQVFWGWNAIWLDPRFLAWNIEDRLPAIDCPILLIQGADDEYGTRAQLDSIAAKASGAEIVLLAACGHSPHRDQRDAVIEQTIAFVKTVTARLGATE